MVFIKVERIFKKESNVKLDDIVYSILTDKIDVEIEKYYNLNKVNFTTSPITDNKNKEM